MSNQYGLDTKPYQLHMTQLEIADGQSSTLSKTALNKLATQLKEVDANLVLPIACTTDNEDKYYLLTGFDIYQATKLAGFDQIWVFIIAASKTEAVQWMTLHGELSKLNDALTDPAHVEKFIEFINDQNADLTTIKGVGTATAQKIASKRPYQDLADIQAKLGKKQPLNWIRSYQA